MRLREIKASGIKLSATSTSSSGTLGTNGNLIVIHNRGTVPAFIRYGNGAQTAVITDACVGAGTTRTFDRNPTDDTTIAAVCESAETATLYVTLAYEV